MFSSEMKMQRAELDRLIYNDPLGYADLILNDCIADQKTVEDEIEARELARIIEAFLDTLTAKERVIFMRRYAYADTYADIAKRVGISEKNVSVRLTLIRQKMKQYLIEREVFV